MLVLAAFGFVNFYRTSKHTGTRSRTEVLDNQAFISKTFEKDGISISFPQTWVATTYDVASDFVDSEGFIPIFYVIKPNLSKTPKPEDAPTKNMVMVDVRSARSNSTLDDASDKIIHKSISSQFMSNYIYEDGNLNGIPTKYVYMDVGDVTLKKAEYPSYLIFKPSLSEVAIISIDFFSVDDPEYYSNTVKEINSVIETINVTK